jgi:hypothetical protein
MKKSMDVNKDRSREDGVALIMVLALLSLVLILALAFAQNSQLESQAASNTLQIAKSRMMAKSTVDRAISLLNQQYAVANGVYDDDDYYPATSPSAAFYSPTLGPYAGRQYLSSTSADKDGIADALAVNFGSNEFLPPDLMDASAPDLPTSDDRGWIHTTSNGRIVGRTAFMIIDDSGKLDPNSVVADSGSEVAGQAVRVGADDSEIALGDTSITNPGNYDLATGKKWFSFAHLANELSPADYDTVLQTLGMYSYSEENYWNDDDNDGEYDDGELYDRIDLTDSAALDPVALYKRFVAANAATNGDLVDDNDSNWIKTLADDGIAGDAVERRRIAAQIALNIKDYMDVDSQQTPGWVNTDGTLTLTDPGAANTENSVLGHENVPGLSELSCMLDIDIPKGKPGAILDSDYTVGFAAELYAPYGSGTTLPAGTYVDVTFSLTVETHTGSHDIFTKETMRIVPDLTVNEDTGTLWYTSAFSTSSTVTLTGELTAGGTSQQVYASNFQIDSVIVYDGTQFVDAFPANKPPNEYWWNWDTNSTSSSEEFYATLEAYNPLFNSQDEADHSAGKAEIWRALPKGNFQMYTHDRQVDIGALTQQSGPNATQNTAEGGGSSILSNDYGEIWVKNSPFERVGELGRVSSYIDARSVRFWAANSGDEAGMDSHLLDMFKIGTSDQKRGKINVNAINSNVLTALFTDTLDESTKTVLETVAAAQSKRADRR